MCWSLAVFSFVHVSLHVFEFQHVHTFSVLALKITFQKNRPFHIRLRYLLGAVIAHGVTSGVHFCAIIFIGKYSLL